MSANPEFILTLACPDTTGIVYRVSGFLFERDCNIIDSAQFGDESTGLFWALRAGQPVRVRTPFSLFPLLTGRLPRRMVKRLVDHVAASGAPRRRQISRTASWSGTRTATVAPPDRPAPANPTMISRRLR